MSHIFISYSRKDTPCVRRTVNRLEGLGYCTWFDQHSIPDGEDWRRSIQQGVAGAAAALVFWSAHSAASKYVAKEIDLALGRHFSADIPIITLRLDDTPLSDALRNYQAPAFKDCTSYGPFEKLLPSLPAAAGRQWADLDKHIPVAEQAGATSQGGIVVYPLVRSVHAQADVVCDSKTVVRDVLKDGGATAMLLIECLGTLSDDQFLRRAVEHFRAQHPDAPLLGLRVRGPAVNDKLGLDNDAPGQWLDVAHLAGDAATRLFGRGSNAALDVYVAAPAALALGIGTRFGPRFWRLRIYNYNTGKNSYHLVYETTDMPEN
jgi:hypothetical protein